MMNDRFFLATIYAFIFILIALVLTLPSARGHEASRPDLDSWFMGLQSKSHFPCCDGKDATHLAAVDWDMKDGHYRVSLEGQWIDVPDSAVIDEPNRLGSALVWPFSTEGVTYIRCFLPGAMT